MNYNKILQNIAEIINYLTIYNSYLIDIYRVNNDIRIDIVDKETDKLIYKKDFLQAENLYNYLVGDLINIFGCNKIVISKLFQEKRNIYQQGVFIDNLEFRFDVKRNFIDMYKAAFRHQEINNKAQKQRTKVKQKTNHVIAG